MEISIKQIETEIRDFKLSGKSLCISSSFQTHSLPLLHIVSRIIPDIPVLFIDTGFHFPETYEFRDKITKAWNLNLINLKSRIPKSQQKDAEGRFFYNSEPDYCCHINKTLPLQREIVKYDVWIAGLRRNQTAFRKNLKRIEPQGEERIKYHPILDWSSEEIRAYSEMYKLPSHPLESKGYLSIGCMPCTAPPMKENGRTGRWYGRKKKECGIHTNVK